MCTACASSIDAIGTAARLIADGRADAAITGGTEGGSVDDDEAAEFVPATYYSGNSYGMSSQEPDPAGPPAVRRRRRGIVSGEGSAMLFLEREDHARARGAHIYGIVRGYGTVADAFHPSSPEPSGRWEQRAMELAARGGRARPRAPSMPSSPTPPGTPKGDTAEIRALNNLFGGRGLPVTSLKGTIGHTGAVGRGDGPVRRDHRDAPGKLAPTMGTTDPEPEIDFDVVLHAAADVGRRPPGERVRLRRSGRLARRHEGSTSSASALADGGGSSNSSWRRYQNDHGACGQPSGTSSSSDCPP